MDPIAVICLYSQYSTNCDMFVAKIKKNNIDFIQLIPLDTLYSRKMVSTKIKKVPAIAVQYPNSLEIYEGMEAFSWLDEVIENKNKEDVNNAMAELHRQKELLELEKNKLQNKPPEKPIESNTSTELNSSSPDTSQSNTVSEGFTHTNAPRPGESDNPGGFSSHLERSDTKGKSQKDRPTYTPIDDVVVDEIQKPDVGDRNETGTTKKLSASSKKTQDLLARARELEKGREDLGNRKPPFPVQ